MDAVRWLVLNIIRLGLQLLCRVHSRDLAKVPKQGPVIVYSNHTGSIEVPMLFVILQPRPLTGIAKAESWDNPLKAWLFDLWGIIPIRRGDVDMDAMRKSLECLNEGKILGMSPEGTRNKTGKLLRGHPGIVTLAIHSGAPLIPLAHWGGENLGNNLKKIRKTDFHARVGNQFAIRKSDGKFDRTIRQAVVDELMYQLAVLLPEEYRGEYSDLSKATTNYLLFQSND